MRDRGGPRGNVNYTVPDNEQSLQDQHMNTQNLRETVNNVSTISPGKLLSLCDITQERRHITELSPQGERHYSGP